MITSACQCDGFHDVIFGALWAGNLFSGAAYVVYGGHNMTSLGVVVMCDVWQFCGYSVSGAGGSNVVDIV